MGTERNKTPLTEIQGSIDITGICTSPCPFLGSEHDRITPNAYPHPGNRCYRHEPAIERQLQFQRSYCLADGYTNYTIFQQEGDPTPPTQ